MISSECVHMLSILIYPFLQIGTHNMEFDVHTDPSLWSIVSMFPKWLVWDQYHLKTGLWLETLVVCSVAHQNIYVFQWVPECITLKKPQSDKLLEYKPWFMKINMLLATQSYFWILGNSTICLLLKSVLHSSWDFWVFGKTCSHSPTSDTPYQK